MCLRLVDCCYSTMIKGRGGMSMRTNMSVWRESASLILAAKTWFSQPNPFNYKVLFLKRSSKSKFMPGTFVFPGGASSKSDKSEEWWKIYEKYGFKRESFNELKPIENLPTILQNEEENVLPKYLSFRICAIRETFEECGILLCKSSKIGHDINSKWASFIGGPEFIKWQQKVIDDPEEFLNMCTRFEIYPDVWALKTWSNWITPPALPLRFNAINFLASFNQMPAVNKDSKEIQDLMWTTPDECLDLNKNKTILLPPPQTYEISRLRNISYIETLANFAHERSKYGCEEYWPYRIKDEEGTYSVLPGDDLYPGVIDKDKTEVPQVPKLEDSKVKNRMLHKSEYLSYIQVENLTPKCNQLVPTQKN